MSFHFLLDGFEGRLMVFNLVFVHEDLLVQECHFMLKLLDFEVEVEVLLGDLEVFGMLVFDLLSHCKLSFVAPLLKTVVTIG